MFPAFFLFQLRAILLWSRVAVGSGVLRDVISGLFGPVGQEFSHLFHGVSVGGIGRDIVQLIRIVGDVKQFLGGYGIAKDHDLVGREFALLPGAKKGLTGVTD